MSLGPGEHEVRKLQSTGGSTFTLSLPKPWINEFDLEARDSLRVDSVSYTHLTLPTITGV